jgi:hypothetical protein
MFADVHPSKKARTQHPNTGHPLVPLAPPPSPHRMATLVRSLDRSIAILKRPGGRGVCYASNITGSVNGAARVKKITTQRATPRVDFQAARILSAAKRRLHAAFEQHHARAAQISNT